MAMGFAIIGEMDQEQLITEILDYHRTLLADKTTAELRSMVVEARLGQMRERLVAEAGIKVERGMFGGSSIVEADNDDG